MRALAPLVAFTSLGLLGCPPPNRPASAFPTADDALARMHATYACVNGVQGVAKIDHSNPNSTRIRGEVDLTAVNPERVRFEIVSPFGAVLYTLTSDGRDFKLFDLKEKTFSTGPAKGCQIARITQVPIPGHALVALLRGEAPVLKHDATGATITWDPGGFYRVALDSSSSAREEIQLEVRPEDQNLPWNQQRVRIRDVLVSQAGVDLYHAELKNHAAAKTSPPRDDPDGIDPTIPPSGPLCDAELPRSIRFRVPNTQEDLIFQYKEAKWNPPLVAGAFTQPVPGGVKLQQVDCKE